MAPFPTRLDAPLLWERPVCNCHWYYQFYLCGCPDRTVPVGGDRSKHVPSFQGCPMWHKPYWEKAMADRYGFQHNPNPPVRNDPSVLSFPCYRHLMESRVFLPPAALRKTRGRLMDPKWNPASAARRNLNTHKVQLFQEQGRTWEGKKRVLDEDDDNTPQRPARRRRGSPESEDMAEFRQRLHDLELQGIVDDYRRRIEAVQNAVSDLNQQNPTGTYRLLSSSSSSELSSSSGSSASSVSSDLQDVALGFDQQYPSAGTYRIPPLSFPSSSSSSSSSSTYTTNPENTVTSASSAISSSSGSSSSSAASAYATYPVSVLSPETSPPATASPPSSSDSYFLPLPQPLPLRPTPLSGWPGSPDRQPSTPLPSPTESTTSSYSTSSSYSSTSSSTISSTASSTSAILPSATTTTKDHFTSLTWLLEEQLVDLWAQDGYRHRCPPSCPPPAPPAAAPALPHLPFSSPSQPLLSIEKQQLQNKEKENKKSGCERQQKKSDGIVRYVPHDGNTHQGYHAGAYKVDEGVLMQARVANWWGVDPDGKWARAVGEWFARGCAGGGMGWFGGGLSME